MPAGRWVTSPDWHAGTAIGQAAACDRGTTALGILQPPPPPAAAGLAHRGRGLVITRLLLLPAAAAVCKVHNIAVIPCRQAGTSAGREIMHSLAGAQAFGGAGGQAGRDSNRRVRGRQEQGWKSLTGLRRGAGAGLAAAHPTLPPLQPGASWLSRAWPLQGGGSRGCAASGARCMVHELPS